MPPEPEWIISEPDAELLSSVEGAWACESLSPLVRRLLCLRGFCEPEAIERFLFPRLRDLSDPFLLPEMDKAVDRLLAAVDSGEEVVLYGDYDVDGVTSLTLLKSVLEAYGLSVGTFLPSRTGEGYGISREGIERCLEEYSPGLLVAVDCGTSSAEEIAWLGDEREIDVIVLDHHECPERRPDCVALVNPKAPPGGGETGFEYLCSAGVVFKVAHALLKRRPLRRFDLRRFIDIAALGTVADIVPLVDENRLLVRKGLAQLERTEHPGLRELKRVASVNGRVQASDVGFRLGPRLNAAGRMDSAQSSLDLLLTGCRHEARRLADLLDTRNRERQAMERRTFAEAQGQLDETHDTEGGVCIVLGSEGWHQGVVGIVASRMMRRYHRPTFVVSFGEDGVGKGSGRSVPGVSLIDAIDHCRDLLINGGGHDMAAGITLERQKFDAFRERFEKWIGGVVRGGDALVPRLEIDAETTLAELTLEMLDSYELLQPFGSANPEPLFVVRGVAPDQEPVVLKERHLRLRLRGGGEVRDAIFFGGAERELPRPPWDVAFHVNRNIYRGNQSVQLTVQAIRGAAAPEGGGAGVVAGAARENGDVTEEPGRTAHA